jgi:hypothetical protein
LAAVLLTLAVFAFWLVTGYAFLAVCRRTRPLPDLLLAPAVGLAVTLLPVFLLNHAGLPVARVGWPVTVALAVAAAFVLWRRRPPLGLRAYFPFVAVLLAGLFLAGRPMLQFGFDWLSYCNDDMTNYCLSAHRFLHHGFNELPALDDLTHGRDYSQYYWFMHVAQMIRPGADLVLAWVLSLTGLTAHQGFMPVILAFHLTLISAAGGLVCRPEGQRWVAWWTCVLLALSAETTLGALLQLFGQVPGLALLAATAAELFRPFRDLGRGEALRQGGLLAALLTALLVVYPEVLPFLAPAYLLYLALSWREWLPAPRRLLTVLGTAAAGALLMLNNYALGPLQAPIHQLRYQAPDKESLRALCEIFPYYLSPRGLAHLWGFTQMFGEPAGRWHSAGVVAGGVLLVAAALAALCSLRRHPAPALLTLMMLLAAGWLLRLPNGFGLFKLAMFVQPFLLAVVAVGWCRAVPWRVVQAVGLIGLAAAGWAAQAHYVEGSRGAGIVYVDLPQASQRGLNRELDRTLAGLASQRVVVDTYNSALAKFIALHLRGVETAMPSIHTFPYFFLAPKELFLPGWLREVDEKLALGVLGVFPRRLVPLGTPAPPAANALMNEIGWRADRAGGSDFLLCGTYGTTALNRRHLRPDDPRYVFLKPWDEVHNHLVFLPTDLGALQLGGLADPVGLFTLSPDPAFPGRSMAGVGRHLLFDVLAPTPSLRVRLEITTTYKGDGVNRLPPAVAVGVGRHPFPAVGRGSARVFSPPLAPQPVGPHACVALDMGEGGGPSRHTQVAAVRDVSLFTEEEYAALRPPARLEKFPQDLLQPDLEYAGLYEDGWVGEECFCCLARPDHPATLRLRGQVPGLSGLAFSTELRLLLDGREVARRTLGVGLFEINAPAPAGKGRARVELRFSRSQPLPAGDGRPVSALVQFLGLVEGGPSH